MAESFVRSVGGFFGAILSTTEEEKSEPALTPMHQLDPALRLSLLRDSTPTISGYSSAVIGRVNTLVETVFSGVVREYLLATVMSKLIASDDYVAMRDRYDETVTSLSIISQSRRQAGLAKRSSSAVEQSLSKSLDRFPDTMVNFALLLYGMAKADDTFVVSAFQSKHETCADFTRRTERVLLDLVRDRAVTADVVVSLTDMSGDDVTSSFRGTAVRVRAVLGEYAAAKAAPFFLSLIDYEEGLIPHLSSAIAVKVTIGSRKPVAAMLSMIPGLPPSVYLRQLDDFFDIEYKLQVSWGNTTIVPLGCSPYLSYLMYVVSRNRRALATGERSFYFPVGEWGRPLGLPLLSSEALHELIPNTKRFRHLLQYVSAEMKSQLSPLVSARFIVSQDVDYVAPTTKDIAKFVFMCVRRTLDLLVNSHTFFPYLLPSELKELSTVSAGSDLILYCIADYCGQVLSV